VGWRVRGSFTRLVSYDDGNLRIDVDERLVSIGCQTIDLRPRDYDVPTVLINHRGEVLCLEQLID
jgi:DNA-binding response OmpR family regulator